MEKLCYCVCKSMPMGLAPGSAYKSMCLLCDIVSLISQPILTLDDVTRLYRLLHDYYRTYRDLYVKFQVPVNYHMALHLPDIILDYGPPHAFWCFSYERMNKWDGPCQCFIHSLKISNATGCWQRWCRLIPMAHKVITS